MIGRYQQLGFLTLAIIFSWYGMMAIHELGHCLTAIATGGGVEKIHIPLKGYSLTEYTSRPSPLLTIWAGPIFGALFPLLFLPTIGCLPRVGRHFILFFAGFCLIANGIYLGLGSQLRVGDCEELYEYGAHAWQMILPGSLFTMLGFYLWHRMGDLKQWFSRN
jgi:hypothetical protein